MMRLLQYYFPDITLNKLARWSAILGGLALLVALVFYLAERELAGFGFAFLVVGVIGLGFWILVAPDELRDWLTGRQVYYGTGTAIVILMVIAGAVVLYSLIERQNIIVDATEYSVFTLSEPSIQALEQMEVRLQGTGFTPRIVGFYTRQNLREQESAAVLLRQFVEKSNGSLDLQFVDPDVDPLLARQYAFGRDLGDGTTSGPLYLTLFDPEGQISNIESIGFPDERSVATAMLRIAVAGQFKVYFETGHTEYEAVGVSEIGLSGAYFVLPSVGILTETLDLSQVSEVPADADALIIAGPLNPFTEEDVAKIAAYVEHGGRLLITADPPYADTHIEIIPNTSFLEDDPLNQYLWSEFGVRFSETMAVERGVAGDNLLFFLAVHSPASTITATLGSNRAYVALARTIEAVDLPNTPDTYIGNQPLYRREPLLVTSQASFGETSLSEVDAARLSEFDEDEDSAGPLILGVAVNRIDELNQDIQPRLILIGDTDWLTNAYIQPQDGSEGITGNILLWNNVVEWLTQYAEIATIAAANRPDLFPLVVTPAQQSRIQAFTLVLMPGLVLALGVIVWGRRRRH